MQKYVAFIYDVFLCKLLRFDNFLKVVKSACMFSLKFQAVVVYSINVSKVSNIGIVCNVFSIFQCLFSSPNSP